MNKRFIITTSIISVILQSAACKAAYNERGYLAAGGEMFVIPIVIYISYKIFANREEIKGMDTGDVAAQISEMAHSMNLLPDSKTVSFNAETNGFEVVESAESIIKRMSAESDTTLRINAEGDVTVLDTADEKLKALKNAGEVDIKFNVENQNFDILNKAGAGIGTIEADGTVNWKSGDVETPEIPDAEAKVDVTPGEVQTPEVPDAEVKVNAVPGEVQAPEVPEIEGSVAYKGVWDNVGEAPDKDGTAKYTSDYSGVTEPPDKNGTAKYKGDFTGVGDPPVLHGTIIYKKTEEATGTSFFPGGLAQVNDQKGIADPTELIYENGRMFTLAGKNVLTSLERGAKIFNAAETQAIMAGDISVLRKRLNEREMSGLDALSGSMFGRDQQFMIPTVPAYANGTTDSADAFIAGEEGPELIVGKQGSTVFPSSETDKILSRANDDDDGFRVSVPKSESKSDSKKVSADKKLVIEINGSGSIKTDNAQAAAEYVMRQLKPTLMEMFEQELYEEGDKSRDF